jgi:hypothetical protein
MSFVEAGVMFSAGSDRLWAGGVNAVPLRGGFKPAHVDSASFIQNICCAVERGGLGSALIIF